MINVVCASRFYAKRAGLHNRIDSDLPKATTLRSVLCGEGLKDETKPVIYFVATKGFTADDDQDN